MTRVLRRTTAAVGVALALAVGAVAGLYAAAPVGALRGTLTYQPPGSTTPRRAGLGADANVGLDEVPEPLLVALLFAEDKKFFTHRGFDFEEIGHSVREWLDAGRPRRGASTLTQQLARMVFLSRDRSVRRKVFEAIYAVKLESSYTKDEILSLYVNNVEWGPGVYGIAAAAAHWFSTVPAALDPSQCAFLVAILPNPLRLPTAFAKRRGVPLRMQRMLSVVERAGAVRVEAANDPDDPLVRLLPAVRELRKRASAR